METISSYKMQPILLMTFVILWLSFFFFFRLRGRANVYSIPLFQYLIQTFFFSSMAQSSKWLHIVHIKLNKIALTKRNIIGDLNLISYHHKSADNLVFNYHKRAEIGHRSLHSTVIDPLISIFNSNIFFLHIWHNLQSDYTF